MTLFVVVCRRAGVPVCWPYAYEPAAWAAGRAEAGVVPPSGY
ncbi:hypothetical protein ABZ840_17615 [Streptomyces sp. NPDC047117]